MNKMATTSPDYKQVVLSSKIVITLVSPKPPNLPPVYQGAKTAYVVQVTDDGGKPVSGKKIYMTSYNVAALGSAGGTKTLGSCTTGSNGQCTIDYAWASTAGSPGWNFWFQD